MRIELNNTEVNVELEVGQETTISTILEEMSIAAGFREDYLADEFGGLTEEVLEDKKGSLGIDFEGNELITFFDIIEVDEYNQMNTTVKITDIQ